MSLKEQVQQLSYLPAEDIAIRLNVHIDEVREHLKPEKYSPKDIARLYNTNASMTARDIAKMIDCSYQYVARSLAEEGIDFKQRTEELKRLEEERIAQVVQQYYNENKSVAEMCELLNVAPYVIRKAAKALDINLTQIKTRKREENMRYIIEQRKQRKSIPEIAADLGLSANYVNVMLSDARKQGMDAPYLRVKKKKEGR